MKIILAVVALSAGVISHQALAQDAVKVCDTLARSGLIDTQSQTTRSEQAAHEVDLFCNEESRFESNYATKSKGFRSAFKKVGVSLGLSGNAASGSGFTSSDFKKMCTDRRSNLRTSYFQQYDISTGSGLASNVVDCLRIVSENQEYVYGEVSLTPNGKSIVANIKRKGSLNNGIYYFSGINASSDFGNCTIGDKPAISAELFENLSISCEVSAENNVYPPRVAGTLLFCRPDGSCGDPLTFDVTKKSYVEQVLEEHINSLKSRFDTLERSLAGSVVAFANAVESGGTHPECPIGWELYGPAQGRFVRGYDRDGLVDPRSNPADSEVRRKIGSIWDDTVISHNHTANMEIGAEPLDQYAQALQAAGAHGRVGVMYTSTGLTNPYGSEETSPKSVVLLYCIKN